MFMGKHNHWKTRKQEEANSVGGATGKPSVYIDNPLASKNENSLRRIFFDAAQKKGIDAKFAPKTDIFERTVPENIQYKFQGMFFSLFENIAKPKTSGNTYVTVSQAFTDGSLCFSFNSKMQNIQFNESQLSNLKTIAENLGFNLWMDDLQVIHIKIKSEFAVKKPLIHESQFEINKTPMEYTPGEILVFVRRAAKSANVGNSFYGTEPEIGMHQSISTRKITLSAAHLFEFAKKALEYLEEASKKGAVSRRISISLYYTRDGNSHLKFFYGMHWLHPHKHPFEKVEDLPGLKEMAEEMGGTFSLNQSVGSFELVVAGNGKQIRKNERVLPKTEAKPIVPKQEQIGSREMVEIVEEKAKQFPLLELNTEVYPAARVISCLLDRIAFENYVSEALKQFNSVFEAKTGYNHVVVNIFYKKDGASTHFSIHHIRDVDPSDFRQINDALEEKARLMDLGFESWGSRFTLLIPRNRTRWS